MAAAGQNVNPAVAELFCPAARRPQRRHHVALAGEDLHRAGDPGHGILAASIGVAQPETERQGVTRRLVSQPDAAAQQIGTWHAVAAHLVALGDHPRSEEHTSELQSLMRTSYAVFFLKNKTHNTNTKLTTTM